MAIHFSFDSGSSGVGVTRREELAELISIVSPLDTPLYTLLEHVPSNNITFEWVVDNIAAPTAAQGKAEGGSFSGASVNARTRLSNTHMIWWEHINVSRTQRLMDEVGIDDEFTWQEVRTGLSVAKQFETNLRWSTYTAGSATATVRSTAGLMEWLVKTGISSSIASSVGGNTIPTAYSASWHDQSDGNLTRTILHDNILKPCFNKGMQIGDAIAFCPVEVKRFISNFAVAYGGAAASTSAGGRVNRSQHDDALVEVVDVYATDVGPLAIAVDRYMNNSFDLNLQMASSTPADVIIEGEKSFFIIDPRFFQISVLDPIHFEPVAKTQDSTEGIVLGEMGLKVLNPRAGGGASGITGVA